MRKPTPGASADASPADETPPAADTPTATNPHAGGCYVRQPDGSLRREDD